MSDVQIAVIDQQDTQIVLAVPGVQGATGSSIPSGGTTDQVLRKNSSTDYDANWAQVTSAMIANGTIVNDDINNSAAIAGTKISPDFGGQAVTTTGQVSAARVNVTSNTPPSNGIYLPSANNVAISTGGSGRLFVDASGRVSIGSSNPGGQPLAVSGGAILVRNDTELVRFNDAADSTYWFRISRNSSNIELSNRQAGALTFLTSDTERLRITSTGTVNIVGAGSAGSTQAVSFNGSAPINSLVLTSGGLLGVGTSSPGGILDIRESNSGGTALAQLVNTSNTASSNARFKIATGGTSAGNPILQFTNDTSNWYINADQSDSFKLKIGTTVSDSKFVVDSSGNVGIGASSPGSLLQVGQGTASTYTDFAIIGATTANYGPKISLQHGGSEIFEIANYGRVQGGTSSDVLVETVGSNKLQLGTNRTVALTIDTSQRVGIGTTASPAGASIRLTLDGSNGGGVELVANNNGGGALVPSAGGGIQFYTHTGAVGSESYSERARIDSSGTFIVKGVGTAAFSVNGGAPNNSLIVDSSGRLLVGTSTSPSAGGQAQYAKFVIAGNTSSAVTQGILNITRGQAASSTIGADTEVGHINFTDSVGNEFARITCATDGAVSSASDLPGRLVFSTTSDGQPSPTPRLTITSTGQVRLAGAGITFNGDTATANELDDYEEGTWTPSISGLTGFDTPSGTYTKIGRMVYCSFWVDGTYLASYTITDPVITSLPFTAGLSQAVAGSAAVFRMDSSALIVNPTAITGVGELRIVMSNSGTNNPSRGFGGQFAYRV